MYLYLHNSSPILPTPPKPNTASPIATVDSLYRWVIKAKLWEDPKKWKQAQALLEKLEALVPEE